MNILKVLIIGDSYGLPRFAKASTKVELYYEETYPEQLRQILRRYWQEDILVVNRCRHANTTYSLLQGEASEVAFLQPEYVVIQLGLADLWPSSLRNVPPLQKALEDEDPWVSSGEYEEYLGRFLEYLNSQKTGVVLVNIPKVYNNSHLQGQIETRIVKYNAIIKHLQEKFEKVELVDLHHLVLQLGEHEAVGSDGVHPQAMGSVSLAMEIFKKIKILHQSRGCKDANHDRENSTA